MYNVPNSPANDRPSRGYWAACVALLTVNALIGWFATLIYEGWSNFLEDYHRRAPFWLAFAGFWLLFGALVVPRWLVARRRLLPWIFALQAGAFVAVWLNQDGMLQLYWEQRVAGPPLWYYLSAALWLAMLLHLWLRRRSVADGRVWRPGAEAPGYDDKAP
jgi:hypothetical protein